MRCGLIGRKLGHSYSKQIHQQLADYSYDLLEVEPGDLERLLHQGGLRGLNVTIPYKQAVMQWCTELSPEARKIGSVNTLVFGEAGRISGYNTDYNGFLYLARIVGVDFRGKKVLVLGSGGTSLTVRQAAADAGAGEIVVISRSGENNYDNLGRHADAQVIVNTTPVGMYPDIGGIPVAPEGFPHCTGVLDVVYNPLRTGLVRRARALGIPASGGLPMLVRQAVAAAELFTGAPVPQEKTEAVLRALRHDVSNLVLIGMPGSGKTSIGRELARRMGREFLDTDRLVEQASGRSPSELIAQDGEAAFRILEREAVARAGSTGGRVIATGGGAVLSPENGPPLQQNGRIYFLRRDIGHLTTHGRPLSHHLDEMYARRLPLYRSFADVEIDCNGSVDEAAQAIWEEYYEAACD